MGRTMSVGRLVSVLLWATFFVGCVFLFTGSPGYYSSKSLLHAWELGHVILLFVGGWAYLSTFSASNLIVTAGTTGFGLYMLVVSGFALSSELAQEMVGRSFSWLDIGRDLIGGYAGYVFYPYNITVKRLNFARRMVAAMLVIVAFIPASRAYMRERAAADRLPVLADFEDGEQLWQWSGVSVAEPSTDRASSGARSLKINFDTRKYSGVLFRHFPKDWTGYSELAFDLFNPVEEPIELVLKIHDLAHTVRGTKYEDRFNRRLRVEKGWNRYAIALDDVATAPKRRMMDMDEIIVLQLFILNNEEPRVAYIDEVLLR